MNAKDFKLSSSGICSKTAQGYHAFIPNPLPPHIDYMPELPSFWMTSGFQPEV